MGSGVGLEAAIHSISQGGYGIISKDFAGLMENINKGQPLEKELRTLLKKAENRWLQESNQYHAKQRNSKH